MKGNMGEDLLGNLSSIENHLSTVLSIDSCIGSHDEHELEMNRHIVPSGPPDINLPFSVERCPSTLLWNSDPSDILDVGLGPQIYETETLLNVPKVGRKCAKRIDSIWGAWFFFNFYFKPALNEKSKVKNPRGCNGVAGLDKSDLNLEVFLVQHDMENMYMWVFKERPENALGKMQLRSYMNGHSRQGESPFPFSVDKGFSRSHRMQRKHYRGLSNPQCLHGIEVVRAPNLISLDEEEKKRWSELTGRDFNFLIPDEASDFGSWRTLPSTEFDLERHPPQLKSNLPPQAKRLLNGSYLNLSSQPLYHVNGDVIDLLPACNKRRKETICNGADEECCLPINPHVYQVPDLEIRATKPLWLNDFSGAMKNVYGPVAAAKTIYEDAEGYLIIISLLCTDLHRVKVSWRNTITHGIVKVSCLSTACMPLIKRDDRTFKLTDSSPEHCPPGEFIREISLPTRIPEDAKLEAYYDKMGTVLEVMVPKSLTEPEEHEVRVCLRPHLGPNELLLT